jgi:hypothetical protein
MLEFTLAGAHAIMLRRRGLPIAMTKRHRAPTPASSTDTGRHQSRARGCNVFADAAMRDHVSGLP